MAIKLVPGGHPYHALAEAAASAARSGKIAADDIESITISRPGVTALNGPLHPVDLIDMAHSPAYFTAAGAADGTFSWQHASATKIADPVIHRLIDLVRVGAPPAEDAALFRQGAKVTSARWMDARQPGRSTCQRAPVLWGLHGAMSMPEYRALVPRSGLSARAVEASLGLIHEFRQASEVVRLVALLQVGGA